MGPTVSLPPEAHAQDDRITPPSGAGSPGSAFVRHVETVVKFSTVAVGLVTALGFPAVYTHFARFSIPMYFVGYPYAFKAGLVPAAVLSLVGLYVYTLARQSTTARAVSPTMSPLAVAIDSTPTWLARVTPEMPFYPLVGSVIVFNLVGALAVLTVGLLVLVWLLGQILEIYGLVTLSQRTFLYTALALVLVTHAIALLTRRQTWIHIWLFLAFPALHLSALTMIIYLYAIKTLLYFWTPDLSQVLTHQYVFTIWGAFVGVLGITFVVSFFLVRLDEADSRRRRTGFFGLLGLALGVYVVAAVFYVTTFYPNMPLVLGGGKPHSVVVWVEKDHFPQSVGNRFPQARFIDDGKLIRCERLYLLYRDTEFTILTGRHNAPSPALILMTSSVKAVMSFE